MMGVNLKGAFLCSLRAAHIMARRSSGVIINMSSGGATRAHRGNVAYDASKGGIEAMTRAIRYAPGFDEIWISYQNINEPYIYLLAARPMPPSQAQAEIQLTREPGHFNAVTSIGTYYFVRVDNIPKQLPMLEAIPDRYGGAAFLLQQWQHDGKRILIVRRMD
jgi:hypothetical protein